MLVLVSNQLQNRLNNLQLEGCLAGHFDGLHKSLLFLKALVQSELISANEKLTKVKEDIGTSKNRILVLDKVGRLIGPHSANLFSLLKQNGIDTIDDFIKPIIS